MLDPSTALALPNEPASKADLMLALALLMHALGVPARERDAAEAKLVKALNGVLFID